MAGVAAAIGLGGATGALAQPELVDFKVVDRETRPAAPGLVRHHGRFFVAGEPGGALRVAHHQLPTPAACVLVVMSVDGINVLTGETAGKDQRGYVFEPYQSWDLPGWRKSDSEVAQFVFAPLPQSYAARTGRPADVGVIGIAAFREKVPPPQPPMPVVSADRAEPRGGVYDRTQLRPRIPAFRRRVHAPPRRTVGRRKTATAGSTVNENIVAARRMAPRDEKLGTGHGDRERSVVRTVAFERATDDPEMVQQVEYDTYDNLVAAGVIRMADSESPATTLSSRGRARGGLHWSPIRRPNAEPVGVCARNR